MSVSRRTILKSSVALATGSVSGVSFRRAEAASALRYPIGCVRKGGRYFRPLMAKRRNLRGMLSGVSESRAQPIRNPSV